MRRDRWVLISIALCLSVLSIASVVPTAASPSPTERIAGTQIEPDDVLLQVDIQANGTAAWTVEYRVRLDDQNTTDAFESVQADVESTPSDFTDPFASRMRATAADASNATGREMRVENVSITASRRQLPQEYGIITYRFTWTNFAAVDGETLRAGDALSGFFLDDQTTLLVTWPEGYQPTSVVPDPDDRRERALSWSGPTDFTAGEPRIGLAAGAAAPTASPTPEADTGGGPSLPTLVGGVFALALVGAVAVWVVRHRDDGVIAPTGATPDDDAPAASDPTADPDQTESTPTPDSAPASSPSASDADTTATEDGADDAAKSQSPPDELLSNEERVRRLLEERGGRIKQQEVASTLEWSDAKTSQVVSKMRETGDLESFRLGRENVLSLPEDDES